ncbi:hypothetical protein CJ030_MR7G016701 [Morella rubra]|uniref:procollagen-proline 4-dioxygenase n=1 Tax=Morella rubra TaxID=262757 RepID=A0A6A1UZI5_9ROSI|nr:hypothetical protein CJ030_MR7G016701 [Morella rubra]
MGEMGAGKIERLATKNSMRSLVSCALGGGSEALHLLPSYLTMNLGPSPDFKRAHVKDRKGDTLLFFSLDLDATTDTQSLHGSYPVIEGEKWSATKWIHMRSFDKPVKHAVGDCVDENENCPMWAKSGECEKNSIYMVGSEESGGHCRKSCEGVYVLEGDRQQKRQGPQALAPPWWNVFNFKLKEVLKDNGDMSLFGAVYEFQNPIHPAIEIPKYFIAFRGTLIEPDTRSQDFKLDLQCFCNTIHQSSRFQVAIRLFRNLSIGLEPQIYG